MSRVRCFFCSFLNEQKKTSHVGFLSLFSCVNFNINLYAAHTAHRMHGTVAGLCVAGKSYLQLLCITYEAFILLIYPMKLIVMTFCSTVVVQSVAFSLFGPMSSFKMTKSESGYVDAHFPVSEIQHPRVGSAAPDSLVSSLVFNHRVSRL